MRERGDEGPPILIPLAVDGMCHAMLGLARCCGRVANSFPGGYLVTITGTFGDWWGRALPFDQYDTRLVLIPPFPPISPRSVLDTSVTFYTEDMDNILAANGFSAHSKRLLSWSKNSRS